MFKDSFVILRKELKRLFTDKRMIILLIVLPLVMLPVMYSVMGRIESARRKDISKFESQISVYKGNNRDSQIFNKFNEGLNTLNAVITPITETDISKIKNLISDKDIQLLIIFPDNIQVKYEQMEKFDIQLYYNSTSDYSEHAYRSARNLFNDISEELVEKRLIKLKLSPKLLVPLTINKSITLDEADLAKKGSNVGKIMGIMLPFFIIIYLFANSMAVGIDTIAGEKERGTLAILLVNQVDRLSIVLGKMISVMIAAFVGAASSVLGLILASRFFLSMFGRVKDKIGGYVIQPNMILQFALVVIPLAMLLVCLVLIVSTYARNMKEGQGMIMPIYFVVLILGISNFSLGDIPPEWMRITPIINSIVSLREIFMKSITWQNIFISMFSSLILAGILIYFIMKMFNDEKVLFRI